MSTDPRYGDLLQRMRLPRVSSLRHPQVGY
jgi:hypothetical protein